MSPYPRDVEQTMRAFYRSLRENDRRRYAAIEAAKLGHGGIEYISPPSWASIPRPSAKGNATWINLPDGPRGAGP